ncbi:CBS domain-containing protein [Haloarcula sp. Atlit-7R]|uniref:CBS domain-containing protein n=1 Tax=Haloarcula sp. Atlit-7R TaxID=2282125 RepID=UPI001F3FC1E0|nr:CBS domain-containing protein [Haloarcula sp. Atlit-7R]
MYTIADLPIENTLQTAEYDLELESALRRMSEHSYTQIGVERGGEFVGIVTYRSVVRTLLAFHQLEVRNKALDKISVGTAVEDAHTISEDENLLAVFDALAEYTYIAVDRDDEWRILTDYDLLTQLKQMLEPSVNRIHRNAVARDFHASVRRFAVGAVGRNLRRGTPTADASVNRALQLRTLCPIHLASLGRI